MNSNRKSPRRSDAGIFIGFDWCASEIGYSVYYS